MTIGARFKGFQNLCLRPVRSRVLNSFWGYNTNNYVYEIILPFDIFGLDFSDVLIKLIGSRMLNSRTIEKALSLVYRSVSKLNERNIAQCNS